MHFTLHELDLSSWGTVTAIEPCPPIAPGQGQVVTGRFTTRQVEEITRVQLEDGTELSGTPVHPVWSVDRQDWIPLGNLQSAERLLSRRGEVAVTSVTTSLWRQPVYNLEVHGEHVYKVADAGVLVHDMYESNALKSLVNVSEEASDRLGRWFARYGTDGAESFSARLLKGTDQPGIAWTGNVRQLVDNIAEIQGAIGRNILKISRVASDGLEAAIKAGRFNTDLYAQHLARRLGGNWTIVASQRPGADIWDMIAKLPGD